jgi:hypothetical protein
MQQLLVRVRSFLIVSAFLSAMILSLLPTTRTSAESNTLGSGQTLGTEARLQSADQRYTLVMQRDSNLVQYVGSRPLWASNTAGRNSYNDTILRMQGDGNLVLYAHNNVPIWASNTAGNPGAFLVLQNDANLVVVHPSGRPLWASGAVNNRLNGGERLNPGQFIQSPDRQYRMIMQGDGNLVLYRGNTPLWASNTRAANSTLEMQGDGNLVVYAPGHIAVWASGTFSQYSALIGQNDGNFVVYAPGNNPVWSTKTNAVTPANPSTTPAKLTSCPTMRQGSAGSCVLMLQQYLNNARITPTLGTDGVFGPQTRQAVINYQASRGLAADGVAGPQTLQALASFKPPISAPAPTHRYPASFNPTMAANWAVSNALTPIPTPASFTQLFTGERSPCTTFVSWALANGGMPKEPDWFPFWDANTTQHAQFLYMSSNTPVAPWYAANTFMERFTNKGWAIQRQMHPAIGPVPIAVGDVIYYQWDGTPNHPHVAIVTRMANGKIHVTDQGGVNLNPGSINREVYMSSDGVTDLRKKYPALKVRVLHWQ